MARSAIVGVPYSSTKKPDPVGVVQAFEAIDARVIANSAGAIIRNSLSALNATTTPAAGLLAWVMGDATLANNGVYENTGTSGSPVWVRRGPLPFGHIYAINVGAGSANAIEVTTWLPIPVEDGAALITVPIVAVNTSSTVTISFNNETAITIKTNAGNNPSIGGLTVGTITGLKIGSEFRMLSDQASAAVLSGAEGFANAAAASAAEAAGYATLALNNWIADEFIGDGTNNPLILTSVPGSVNNVRVFIEGEGPQPPTIFTLTVDEITPPTGAVWPNGKKIVVMYGSAIEIGVPSDNSVNTLKIANNAVTANKIEADAVAGKIHAATAKTTPVDDDEFGIADSAASFGLKLLSWANIKATLKTYFDTLYAPAGAASAQIALVTANGYGSSATRILRFATVETADGGSDMTLTQSATDGDKITINTPGVYSLTGQWVSTDASREFGITLNQSSLTTNITANPVAEQLCSTEAQVNRRAHCGRTLALANGDELRLCTDGGTSDTTAGDARFSVQRVS